MNEEIIQNINQRLDVAIDKGREILQDEDLQVRINELRTNTERTIRKHPFASIAAGLAVGFIAAKIFRSED